MAATPVLFRAATATSSSIAAAATVAAAATTSTTTTSSSSIPFAGPSSLIQPLRQRRPRYPPSFITRTASPSHHRSFSSTTSRPASVKDPYATLGVRKSSSAKEIKSAYYDLAKKLHPDVNPDKSEKAKEKFVEIQQAYDILSDDAKKSNFDQFGNPDGPGAFGGSGGGNPFGAGSPFGGFGGFGGQTGGPGDASDIFDSIFGAFGGGGGGGRARGAGFAGESRGDDLETGVKISFEEACRGATRNITINPVERCSPCSGKGLKKGARKTTCGVCNGTGTRTFVIQSGFQMASTCPACGGAGSSIASGDACDSCDGVGRVRGKKTVEIKIPPGVDDGAKIRLEGAGDAPLSGSGPTGSLFVRISVRKSNIWRRQGSNLHFAAKVPLHIALLGGKVRVPTLDGDVDVRVPAGTQVGDEMLLRGRGVQSLMRRGEKGDLLVGFEIGIPRTLTKRQKDILQMYADDVEGKATGKPAPDPSPASPSARSTSSDSTPLGTDSSSTSAPFSSAAKQDTSSPSPSGTSESRKGSPGEDKSKSGPGGSESSETGGGSSSSGGLLGGFWNKLTGSKS